MLSLPRAAYLGIVTTFSHGWSLWGPAFPSFRGFSVRKVRKLNGWLLNYCPPRYIVYDIAQVNLKYLLKLKFNFKTSLW